MVLWARNAVRSVLATALRMPKKAAPPPKKEKAVRDTGPVLETAKPGDPITINYLKAGKGAPAHTDTRSVDTKPQTGRDSMCMYVYVYANTYMYIHTYIFITIHMYIYIYIYI